MLWASSWSSEVPRMASPVRVNRKKAPMTSTPRTATTNDQTRFCFKITTMGLSLKTNGVVIR